MQAIHPPFGPTLGPAPTTSRRHCPTCETSFEGYPDESCWWCGGATILNGPSLHVSRGSDIPVSLYGDLPAVDRLIERHP